MKYFLILLSIVLFSCSLPYKNIRSIGSVEANYKLPFKVDLQEMESFLGKIRSIKSLPNFDRAILAQELSPKWKSECQPIKDIKILDTFNKLVNLAFENIKIPIYQCQWTYNTGTLLKDGIFISNFKDIELKDPNELAAFIFMLAHEISHYLHEISTQKPFSDRDGYSLNYYPSYRLETNNECERLDRQDRQWECEESLWRNGHSEVDIFAALILKKYGFQNWEASEKGTIKSLDKLKGVSAEDKTRAKLRYHQRFKIIKAYF